MNEMLGYKNKFNEIEYQDREINFYYACYNTTLIYIYITI